MFKLSHKTSTVLLTSLLICSIGNAQDLFNRTDPSTFSFLQKITPSQHVRDYPIFNLGNQWGLMLLKTSFSTGTGSGLPLGTLNAVDIRGNKFFAAIKMDVNLEQSVSIEDWVAEPCKREDYLWKKSIGGKFTNINCATINHVVTYFTTPTGEFQQILVKFRELGVEAPPPTIVRVVFTRYSSAGRRLIYSVDINPETFGVDRDIEHLWGANSWHKSFVQKDPKKVQFVANLSKWAEEVQNRMDKAFDKKSDAFVGMPEFSSYFKPAQVPQTTEAVTISSTSIEEKLRAAKDLFEKKLINEQQYNEQVKTILNTK